MNGGKHETIGACSGASDVCAGRDVGIVVKSHEYPIYMAATHSQVIHGDREEMQE